MDIHLDTSWCPVCEQQILPKRYLVPVPPVPPPPSSLPVQQIPPPQISQYAVKQSQTMRGQHGIIKARAQGGGLLHGTGRVRPGGGLRRDLTRDNVNGQQSNGTCTRQKQSAERRQEQQAQNFALEHGAQLKQRTVIDQAQTPLYCSDECRLADAELDFDSPLPSPIPINMSRNGIATHPSRLNPAQASPPPPSPVLPHVPHNSYRDNDTDHSDSSSSSSMSGSYFGTSSGSSQELPNLFTDPSPPAIAPLPLHPHRPSAPVAKVITERSPLQNNYYEGGIMMAARRVQQLISKSLTALKDEEQRQREERQREAWDLTKDRRGLKPYGIGLGAGVEVPMVDKGKEAMKLQASLYREWIDTVRGQPQKQEGASPHWIASTHRNPIGLMMSVNDIATAKASIAPQTKTSPSTTARRATPTRAQSALELYAKYPLFTRPTHSRSRQPLPALPTTSTSYTAAYAQSLSAASLNASDDVADDRAKLGASASRGDCSASRVDEQRTWLYDGKHHLSTKHQEPASMVPKGAEGKLLVPNVKLKPTNSSALFKPSSLPSSNSLAPSLSNNRASSMSRLRRNESEGCFGQGSGRGALDMVKEEGTWHVPPPSPNADSEESQSSSGRHSDSFDSTRERKSRKAKSSGSARRSSSSTLSLSKRGRMKMEAPTWSYENMGIPTYNVMPPVPIKQCRIEEVFVPDVPSPDDKPAIHISSIHTRDEEISRKELRDVSRRRGDHEGRPGWWVEKEWEVTAIPERKRLFLFGSR